MQEGDVVLTPMPEARTVLESQIIHPELVPQWKALQEAIVSLGHQSQVMVRPTRVAFVGRFTTGKSRLINALTESDLLPSNMAECTSTLVEIAHGPEPAYFRLSRSDLDTAGEHLVQREDFLKAVVLAHDTKQAHYYRCRLPHPMLRKIHFVDTPGFDGSSNGSNERASATIHEALRQADLCIFVLSKGPGLDDVERLQKALPLCQQFLFVLNKADQYDLDDLEDIREEFRSTFTSILGKEPKLLCCSALWQNGTEEERSSIRRQRHLYGDDTDTNGAAWNQWPKLLSALRSTKIASDTRHLVSAIRDVIAAANLVQKAYDRRLQAETMFLARLPEWQAKMPSPLGPVVLKEAAAAAQQHKPLPWRKLANFKITPEDIAPEHIVPQKIVMAEIERAWLTFVQQVRIHPPMTAEGFDTLLSELAKLNKDLTALLSSYLVGTPDCRMQIGTNDWRARILQVDNLLRWQSYPLRSEFRYHVALEETRRFHQTQPGAVRVERQRILASLSVWATPSLMPRK